MSTAQKWNNKVMFPKDNYVLRVVDESFGPSKSSGNPMITLEYEIVLPEEVEVGDNKWVVAGTRMFGYYTTQNISPDTGELDVEKTANAAKRLEELYKNFGLSFENFNPENPVLGFKGRSVHALVYGKATEQRKSPTSEQLKQGKPGDVIVNPVTKQNMVSYQPNIDTIYGLAEVAGQAFN